MSSTRLQQRLMRPCGTPNFCYHPRLTLQNLWATVLFQTISPQTDFFQERSE
jgi:hypothetical protein